MSVPEQTTFTSSTANGVTTVFPYSFMIADEADLTVELDGVVQTVGFTISGVGNPSGGNITFSVAPANGVNVLRYLDPVLSRDTDYPQFGDLLASVLNLDFDRVWLALQALIARADRSIKLPVDTANEQLISEPAATRAGKLLGFNGDGDAALYAAADVPVTAVSPYIATLLNDTSAEEARATLGAANRFTVGGTADAMTGSVAATIITSYAAGLRVSTTPAGANTVTGPTLNLNSLGAKTIKKRDSSGSKVALVAGDYNASGPFDFEYDGTDFVLLNPLLQSSGSSFVTNKVINGGFSINQRLATSVADDAYCLDRWYVLTETGNVTVAQQTDQENGTPHNIRLTQPDVSAKRVALAQIIESRYCKDLRGKVASLGLRLRNSTGGQINYAILEWSGTADSVTSDVISAWAGSPTYIGSITERANGTLTPSANTWTDATAISGTINAAANNLIVLIWSNDTFAQNATLDIGRVQLEEGTATAFKARPIEQELALCQRYYEKSYDIGTAPGTSVSAGSELIRQSSASEAATAFNRRFTVNKRATPTVVFYNPNTANDPGKIYDIGAAAARTVTGTYSNSPTSETTLGAPTHSAAGSAGNLLWAHWTANAEL